MYAHSMQVAQVLVVFKRGCVFVLNLSIPSSSHVPLLLVERMHKHLWSSREGVSVCLSLSVCLSVSVSVSVSLSLSLNLSW